MPVGFEVAPCEFLKPKQVTAAVEAGKCKFQLAVYIPWSF
jgi:hypothetical protein